MNKETMKRVIALLLLGALVLGIIPLAALATEAEGSSSSIGIIGGADGPTAIFVSGNWGGLIAIAAAVLCVGIAVIVALKKRKQ